MIHKSTIWLLMALAATAASAEGPPRGGLELPFERYALANGLEVILHQDRRVPLVVVNVWYHVGSGDETPDSSGFAHLFEHMMFQGSKHTGEDVHFKILREIGASSVNGTTNSDRTNYFEVVPAHQLETALWLESDRMGYMLPLLTEKSLANQREVVRNERRQNYDNRPYGRGRFALAALLYPQGHPYRYLTIGRHVDLARASLDDVRRFYQRWYVPANATLCLAGDFEVGPAKRLVQKWFGSFPPSTRPKHHPPATPRIAQRKRKTIRDPLARLRRLHYAWHSPRFFAPGDAELDLLAAVLGREGTGRIYRRLVIDQRLAQTVSVYQASAQYSSTFNLIVDLKPEVSLERVEQILAEELGRVVAEPVPAAELRRAMLDLVSQTIWNLESLLARADRLQRYNHYLGDPGRLQFDLARYRRVSATAVRETAVRTLGAQARVELITEPETTDEPDRRGKGSKR